MATIKVCAVFDSAVETYGSPFFVKADGQAIRMFIDECQNEKGAFFAHASDYSLFCLASFNEESGQFFANDPVCLMRGKDAKAMTED